MKILKYLSLLIGAVILFAFIAFSALPSSQSYGWPASIIWHIFNDKIEFYDMRIKPPLRWRLEGVKEKSIILMMVPTTGVAKTKGLAINKSNGVTADKMIKFITSDIFPKGKMMIANQINDNIGGEKAVRLKFNPFEEKDRKQDEYFEIIVIGSKGFYIYIEKNPIQYKPYFDELLNTITFI